MELIDKLNILADAAKYDAACTSCGSNRGSVDGMVGDPSVSCLVHSVTADGRRMSMLKVLMTNYCIYDCQYCLNRTSNDPPRAAFTPHELAGLVMNFYDRNYIEGLFLSSGVMRDPDFTMELMYNAVRILRKEYRFNSFVHVKTIPGASDEWISKMGFIVDRVSVNIEMPSEASLVKLAPNKTKAAIIKPMGFIRDSIEENKGSIVRYKDSRYLPGGQTTQMIIGASPETDYQILKLSDSLYKKFSIRRVFYSAYVPVGTSALLPKTETPLLREHRLYQTDWLIRFYKFNVDELITEKAPMLDPLLDPKCNWAMNNLGIFPIEINTAPREMLLRVPGIGPDGAAKIITARRLGSLNFEDLKKLRIVLKRAIYFITCNGRKYEHVDMSEKTIYYNLASRNTIEQLKPGQQLSLLEAPLTKEDIYKSITGQM